MRNLKYSYEEQTSENMGGIKIINSKDRKNHSENKPRFLIRIVIAILIFGIFFGISKIDFEIGRKVTGLVKNAILYDLDMTENKQVGEFPVFDEIEEVEKEE